MFKAKDVMTTDVISAQRETPIYEAIRLMVENKIGCLPIVEGGSLVGIVSEIDVLKALLEVLEILE